MAKQYCKKFYQQGAVQLAIGMHNELYLRVHGRGPKGPCWGTWQLIDLNPGKWDKLDESRAKPDYYEPGIKTLDPEFVDTLDTVMDLYKN